MHVMLATSEAGAVANQAKDIEEEGEVCRSAVKPSFHPGGN